MLEKAMQYAIRCHKETNHFYDNDKLPYSHHLSMVVGVAGDYIHLIPEADRENVLAACWCHDVIEDCRQTYNDVKKHTNEKVADIVYAVTNEKGKTRSDRANYKYYEGIRYTRHASFVKICDRIANYEYSKMSGNGMYEKYKKEMDNFYVALAGVKNLEMFKRLS